MKKVIQMVLTLLIVRFMTKAYNKFLLLLFMMLSLSCYPFAEQSGFFRIYERQDKQLCAASAIETNNGDIIISTYDYSGGNGELVKLSENGEILNRVIVGETGSQTMIQSIDHDPENFSLYYGLGFAIHSENNTTLPILIHFDEDLILLDFHEVELPSNYSRFVMSRAIMTSNGKYLFAASLDGNDDYHRLYMWITLDGELEKIFEVTDDCRPSNMINVLFEFPEDGEYGEFRSSSTTLGNRGLVPRLFKFDEDCVVDTLNEYPKFYEQHGDTLYCLLQTAIANSTAIVLEDSAIIFSNRVHEWWSNINTGFDYRQDGSNIFFKTDLNGNILDYIVLGSGNDIIDVPAVYNAIGIAQDEENGKRFFYNAFFDYEDYIPSEKPNRVTIAKIDEDFDIIWQQTYTHPTKYLQACYLLSLSDGGCLLVGGAFENGHFDLFVLKAEDSVGITTENVETRYLLFYPNPAQDQLHLQFSPNTQPVQLELYDLQGHLVRTQDNSFESFDLGMLPAGIYTLRVTMENGQVFSNKVVKE